VQGDDLGDGRNGTWWYEKTDLTVLASAGAAGAIWAGGCRSAAQRKLWEITVMRLLLSPLVSSRPCVLPFSFSFSPFLFSLLLSPAPLSSLLTRHLLPLQVNASGLADALELETLSARLAAVAAAAEAAQGESGAGGVFLAEVLESFDAAATTTPEERLATAPALWKFRREFSLGHLRQEFGVQQAGERLPLLQLWLDEEEKLRGLRHLAAAKDWLDLVQRRYNRRIEAQAARTTTVGQALEVRMTLLLVLLLVLLPVLAPAACADLSHAGHGLGRGGTRVRRLRGGLELQVSDAQAAAQRLLGPAQRLPCLLNGCLRVLAHRLLCACLLACSAADHGGS